MWRTFWLSALLLLPLTAVHACPPSLDFSFRTLAGDSTQSLCETYAGKVMLVVNTASRCGFTPQYEGLEALYDRYRERGLVVLGFPSNDFAQEPGSEEEIQSFCRLTYSIEFPMFEKMHVADGPAVHPFYRMLAAAAGTYPRWNFHKYLIDREGKQVVSFPTQVEPDDPALIAAIEKFL